jgi:hypothetical protein
MVCIVANGYQCLGKHTAFHFESRHHRQYVPTNTGNILLSGKGMKADGSIPH